MGKQYAIVGHGIVVVVVVTAEYSHYVSLLLHGREHAAVERWRVCFLQTGAIHRALCVVGGVVVFRKRDVHEGECGQGLACVLLLVYRAALPVPCYLVVCYPLIAVDSGK